MRTILLILTTVMTLMVYAQKKRDYYLPHDSYKPGSYVTRIGVAKYSRPNNNSRIANESVKDGTYLKVIEFENEFALCEEIYSKNKKRFYIPAKKITPLKSYLNRKRSKKREKALDTIGYYIGVFNGIAFFVWGFVLARRLTKYEFENRTDGNVIQFKDFGTSQRHGLKKALANILIIGGILTTIGSLAML